MQMDETRRRLPIGIETFRTIREEGCYYADKTAQILRLAEAVAALAAIRAVPAGEYGPEQLLAASVLSRGDAGEEMRHAAIAALEHLNEAAVSEEFRFIYDSPIDRLHRS